MIVSAIFSVFTLGGKCYDETDVSQSILSLAFSNKQNMLMMTIVLVAAFIQYYCLICSMPGIAMDISIRWDNSTLCRRIERLFFGKYGVLVQSLLLVVLWLPQAIIRYPSYGSYDAFHSLIQYLGWFEYSTKHPVIYAQTIGRFYDIGLALGHPNFGLFIMSLFQVVLVGSMLVYTINSLAKLGGPKWLCLASLMMLAINPSTIVSATLAQKDVYFAVGFVLLLLEIAFCLYGKIGKRRVQHYIVLFFSIFLMFFRNNGFHIALVAYGALLVWFVASTHSEKHTNKNNLAFICMMTISILIVFGFNKYLTRKYNAENVTTRVIYASTIQQIGRYISLFPDEIEDKELEDLHLVMDASKAEYKKKYNPLSFDDLKTNFNQSASKEDIQKYLHVWAKLGLRHPDVYVAATMHQNTPLFDLLHTNVNYYNRISFYLSKTNANKKSHLYVMTRLRDVFKEKTALIPIQDRLKEVYYEVANLPICGLFCNSGFVNLLLFGMLSCAARKKNGKLLVIALPSLALLAITFLGPCIANNSRYVYPILWSLPILACASFLGGHSCSDVLQESSV
jgi:hypothetical protein